MKLNKKMLIILCSVVATILVFIIVLILVFALRDKSLSFEKIEEKIVSAGMSYYANNPDKLPSEGTITVDTSTLIAEGYLNDLSKYTGDEELICNGTLYVTKKTNGHSYRARLYCGTTYITKSFKDVVVTNVVTSGSGLYEEQQVDPNNNETTQKVYVFKGDVLNNYIKMGDFYWRIVKVYENGEMAVLGDPELMRRVWDNRYNLDVNKYRGINDYEVSRMLNYIDADVNNNHEGFLIIKSLITPHTACIGKRSLNDASKNGEAECSRVLGNQYFSLLPMYDYINASLDENCVVASDKSCYNYNYLAAETEDWWTITGVEENTQDVYYVQKTARSDYANQVKYARLYAHLDANVTYVSGTGTYKDPYVLK